MPGIYNAVQYFNNFIRPESQLPSRLLSTEVCGGFKTRMPAGFITNQLVIVVVSQYIDGVGGTLGQAGPCSRRQRSDGTWASINGQIRLDRDDLPRMLSSEHLFKNLVMHEIGHALGIGTMWGTYNLIENHRWIGNVEQPNNFPKYIGVKGNNEWNAYGGQGKAPIEELGGRGTADSHWKWNALRGELMTGWLSWSKTSVSKVTLGSLDDMGIDVFYDKADSWSISEIHDDEDEEISNDVIFPDNMELHFFNGNFKLAALSDTSTFSYNRLTLILMIIMAI
jgi:hypothetical protein